MKVFFHKENLFRILLLKEQSRPSRDYYKNSKAWASEKKVTEVISDIANNFREHLWSSIKNFQTYPTAADKSPDAKAAA